ncbi:twin-arginine translocation signal domain-containing protein [Gluconobacter sphaericus]|uniref:Twin-arginine translocation signal domain-containing protein n=1 Tax=Gluconobacter sphaericus NBRC 12467 TaxID=1307951 RepID=A0AA37SIG7_9PROT|nr:twin-arginine translocation signal domain-containing protein [Gluconobacter sphaericus]MBF0885560.1 hypothetical protein [Gluconobacter sphaericus]GBR56549.1 hypothetical protein AA12467_2664 [Gluconobacter sphaericus NBRC 12467]GEB43684.1 hypothetical protein GSP01_24660 [Gluconobacter sphaericus NBRC 12467]GLQ86312.1 hypothetical protein GCM10007872_32270 [Gluconobacter sphaericus NBRC 12467]
MRNPSRRGFLRTLGACTAIGALGACTITKNGSVTTVTINVAKVKAYGQAGLNAVSTILDITAVATAIGAPAVSVINIASAALDASLTAFASAAGSSVTVSYDNATMKTRIDSVLADLQKVASDLEAGLKGASSKVSSSILSDASVAVSSLSTVISVFEGLLGVVSARRATMTEAQALRNLGVTA